MYSWRLSVGSGVIYLATFAAGIIASPSSSKALAQSTPPPASQPIPAWQRDAGGKMEFEVASIRPAAPGATWRTIFDLSVEDVPVPPGGRFSATASLGTYLQYAYKVSLIQNQVVFAQVPKWVTTELFDVEATAPTTNPTNDQIRLMMQSLLAVRFKLAMHLETHDVPIMALVPVKPGKFGPRLRLHSQGPACDAKIPPIDSSSPKIPDVWMPVCGVTNLHDWTNHTVILGSRNTTMEIFADYIPLLEQLDRPVIDQTGLTGKYDIELSFVPDWVKAKEQTAEEQADFSGATFFEALKDQLGLKLISTRGPLQTLVIDHVEQPTPN